MNYPERRQYPRNRDKIEVTLHVAEEKIPAILMDIGQRGIGLISEREVAQGSKVDITLNCVENYAIHGTVKWTQHTSSEENKYRSGIEAFHIIMEEDIYKNFSSDLPRLDC